VSQQTKARRPKERPPTRAEKRKVWKEAAARAAAARRRRRIIGGTVGSILVTALLVTLVVIVVRGNGDDKAGSGSQAGTQTTPSAQAFPPLPAGADPALGTKPSVSKGSGELTSLVVMPLIKGTGPAAANGQQLTVNYVGVSFTTGEEFDSSWKGSEPFQFQLGAGGVIKGWDQGLVGVTVGSRVQLDIPANLAYGDNPSGGGPSGPLRFVVDLLAATSGPV